MGSLAAADKLSDTGRRLAQSTAPPYLRPDQKMIGSLLDESVSPRRDGTGRRRSLREPRRHRRICNQARGNRAHQHLSGVVYSKPAARAVKRYVFINALYVCNKSGGFYRCSKRLSIENCHGYVRPHDHDPALRFAPDPRTRADIPWRWKKGTILLRRATFAKYIHVGRRISTVEISARIPARPSCSRKPTMQVGD